MKKQSEGQTGWLTKHTYLLFPLGVLVIGFLMINFLIWPKIDQIRETRRKIKENENLAAEVGKKVRLMQSIDGETLKRQSQVADMALPSKKNIYDLVVVMSNIASAYGFKVESFKIAMGEIGSDAVEIKGDEEGKKLETLPIKVELVGTKESYLDFLLAMEEAIPLLSISKLDLKTKGEGVSVEMTVAVYFSPPVGSLDLDKVSLDDLMMSEEELRAAERLEGFKNYVSGVYDDNSGKEPKKPTVVRQDPFRL